ncbi:alpha/beta hydrolase [Myxococcaceae bacterium GXIMD 01537]
MVAVLGYVGLMAVAFAYQRSLLYPAPKRPPGSLPREAGFRRLERPGAPVVDVLHLPAPAGAPTVVYFHGNGEEIGDHGDFGAALRAYGLGFLAVEYPGYGASPGEPSEEGLYAAAEAAIAELREAGVDAGATVLMGRSLGTGVAVEMARRGHGARLVLLAPFTSVVELGQAMLPFLPVSLLMRDRFDSESKAPNISMPVFIIHGEEDEVIPVELGRRLGGRFPHATVETVPGAHHNDLLEREGGEQQLERIATFARGP